VTLDTRDRLSEGMNATRLRLESRRSFPSLPPIVLGVVATLVGAALIFSQLSPTLFKKTRTAYVAIDDAFGVLPGVNQVRYRGVPAGTIKKIERRGTQVVLKLSVRKDYPIYQDAHAELRPETPLNDMYLDVVDPGSPSAGLLGENDVLPQPQTDSNVKIDDVLNALQPTTRTRLEQLLDNLGNGLADRGAGLRAAVIAFTPFVAQAGQLTQAVARHRALMKDLVHDAAILTTTLGQRQQQVRTLVGAGSATLGALQAGSPDLDRTLRQLPSTVDEIQASFAAVRGVLDDVDGAVTDLGPVADQLPGALKDVRALNAALRPAVRSLARPVDQLVPLAMALRPVAGDLQAAVRALRPQAPSIAKITSGLVTCEMGIIGFFQWNASLSKFGDNRGPIPRGNLAVGTPDVGVTPTVTRRPAPNCAGGHTIGGVVPTAKDAG
jgi:phospholipid/cholesterol/gamma-HCH transport system substrate-binding protein